MRYFYVLLLSFVTLNPGHAQDSNKTTAETTQAVATWTYPNAKRVEVDAYFVDLFSRSFAGVLSNPTMRGFVVQEDVTKLRETFQTFLDDNGYQSQPNIAFSSDEDAVKNESLDFSKDGSSGNVFISGPMDETSIEEFASVAPTLAGGLEVGDTIVLLLSGEKLITDITPDMTAWLKDKALPFETTDPNAPLDDLQPLADIIGRVRIVGLGEATHGTKEFFTMKHRILQFLVEHKGFTTFAIEAGYAEARRVNDYVQTGKGDPAQLVKAMGYTTWATQEVVDLVEWMKDYNQQPEHTTKLTFAGFDMQRTDLARQVVLDYLETVDASYAQEARVSFACLPPDATLYQDYLALSQAERQACKTQLGSVVKTLETNEARYVAASSEETFKEVQQHLRVLMQAERAFSVIPDAARQSERRDAAMAENVAWLLEQEGETAKIVLWAHNGHVGTFDEPKTMGSFLREQYGDEMVVFGFGFYTGSFRATNNGWGVHEEPLPPPLGTHESFFHTAGLPHFFLDLRGIPSSGPVPDWFAQARGIRDIGAGFDDTQQNTNFQIVRLPDVYDVVMYLETTTAAVALE